MNVSPESIERGRSMVTAAAIAAARRAAACELLARFSDTGLQPAAGIDAQTFADILTKADTTDPRYQTLKPFEQQWALLAVRFAEAAARPGDWSIDAFAVKDARARGVPWKDIAAILGITTPSTHTRYKVVKPRASGGRRGPTKDHAGGESS